MKITDLPTNAAPDGSELVPHVRDGESRQAPLAALVDPVAAPYVAAASGHADAAAGFANDAATSKSAAEGLIGPTYASPAAGIAATPAGKPFAVQNVDGTISVYLNNAGAAVLQRSIATTTALAGANGAALMGMTGRTGANRNLADRLLDRVHLFDGLSAAQAADVRSGAATLDIAPQLQAMVENLRAAGGGTIAFDGGCALLASPVRLYDNITLVGGAGGVNGYVGQKGASAFKQAAGAVGSVVNAAIVTAGGAGYTIAAITFSNGATGTVWLSSGAVAAISITDCGLPTAGAITGTITGDGAGATVSVQTCVPMFYQSGAINTQINVENITLIGNYSATSAGIVMSSVTPFFVNFRAYAFGLSAWRRLTGAGGHIMGGHIFGMGRGGMAPGTASYYAGSLDDGGNDLQLSCIEAGAPPSGDSTNLWNAAIHLRGTGSATQLANIVAEGGDVGILCSAQNVMMSNVRADINYGHGVWVHRTNPVLAPPSYTKIWGLWSHRNGRYAANSYDNLRIESGDAIIGTQVRGYSSMTAGSDGVQHRYGLYDGSGAAEISAFSDVGAGTAKFGRPYNYNPGPAQSRTGLTTLAGVATLDVTGQTEIRVSNGSTALTITRLNGAFHGDRLVLIPTASNITLQQGNNSTQGAMMLAGGRDRVLTAWQPVYLINSAGTWYEAQPWAKQAAIASPSADVASLKTAVDAIRTALTALGMTS